MPEELESGILDAIKESRASLERTGKANLETERESCLKSADSRVKELHNIIK